MTRQGFTLLELLITLTVLSVLLMMGLPSFTQWVHSIRLDTATEALSASVQLARSSAVMRNQRVTMRNLGNWASGWEVFVDLDNDGARGGGEPLLLSRGVQTGIRVIANRPVRDYISFVGTGESRLAGAPLGGFQAGTLHVCAQDGEAGYALILAPGGRMRMEKASAAHCA
ncbi:GspH/FimT family protein [Microbulbifer sp. 2205BS26-8]|uniref:GspH/FimT family pseudopilin n=1 Tax=Microbulbifer sp. 2205BS26-8 TaxID=3064386 RepID=UPI00273E3070|nr:GspH/FimT family protein [Microbulbifer sp. 2205BS26-8]MDP5208464.1 GspH/FimT family protein [Microbulbifer sp. 2205BS26-8]